MRRKRETFTKDNETTLSEVLAFIKNDPHGRRPSEKVGSDIKLANAFSNLKRKVNRSKLRKGELYQYLERMCHEDPDRYKILLQRSKGGTIPCQPRRMTKDYVVEIEEEPQEQRQQQQLLQQEQERQQGAFLARQRRQHRMAIRKQQRQQRQEQQQQQQLLQLVEEQRQQQQQDQQAALERQDDDDDDRLHPNNNPNNNKVEDQQQHHHHQQQQAVDPVPEQQQEDQEQVVDNNVAVGGDGGVPPGGGGGEEQGQDGGVQFRDDEDEEGQQPQQHQDGQLPQNPQERREEQVEQQPQGVVGGGGGGGVSVAGAASVEANPPNPPNPQERREEQVEQQAVGGIVAVAGGADDNRRPNVVNEEQEQQDEQGDGDGGVLFDGDDGNDEQVVAPAAQPKNNHPVQQQQQQDDERWMRDDDVVGARFPIPRLPSPKPGQQEQQQQVGVPVVGADVEAPPNPPPQRPVDQEEEDEFDLAVVEVVGDGDDDLPPADGMLFDEDEQDYEEDQQEHQEQVFENGAPPNQSPVEQEEARPPPRRLSGFVGVTVVGANFSLPQLPPPAPLPDESAEEVLDWGGGDNEDTNHHPRPNNQQEQDEQPDDRYRNGLSQALVVGMMPQPIVDLTDERPEDPPDPMKEAELKIDRLMEQARFTKGVIIKVKQEKYEQLRDQITALNEKIVALKKSWSVPEEVVSKTSVHNARAIFYSWLRDKKTKMKKLQPIEVEVQDEFSISELLTQWQDGPHEGLSGAKFEIHRLLFSANPRLRFFTMWNITYYSKAKGTEEYRAVDGGGPTNDFFYRLFNQIGCLKVEGVALFEHTKHGYLPTPDERFEHLTPESKEDINYCYCAMGRMLAYCLLHGVMISSEVMQPFYWNILLRFDFPNSKAFCARDIIESAFQLLDFEPRTMTDDTERLLQFLGVGREGKTPVEEQVCAREKLNELFVQGRDSFFIRSFQDGLTLSNKIAYPEVLGFVPMQVIKQVFFSKKTVSLEELFKVIKLTKKQRKYQKFKDVLKRVLSRKAENDPDFLSKFLCHVTGHGFLPYPDARPDFAITIEFRETVLGHDYNKDQLLLSQTCENTLLVPDSCYDNDMDKLQAKLEKTFEFCPFGFDMM